MWENVKFKKVGNQPALIYIDNKVSVQKQEKKPTYAKLEIKLWHIFIFNE